LAGIVIAALLSIVTGDLNASGILSLDVIRIVLYLAFFSTPGIIIWIYLTLINFAVGLKSSKVALFMPIIAGIVVVVFGFFILLPNIMKGFG